MSDTERDGGTNERRGHIPNDPGTVQGGYQPETSEAGPPPTGGSGGQETSEKK